MFSKIQPCFGSLPFFPLWAIHTGLPIFCTKKLELSSPTWVRLSQIYLISRLASNPKCQIFLTCHIFAPWAMMMKSSSFEIPMQYLFALNLKINIAALLISFWTSWKVPIYYINRFLIILNCTALYYIYKSKPHNQSYYTLSTFTICFLMIIKLTATFVIKIN